MINLNYIAQDFYFKIINLSKINNKNIKSVLILYILLIYNFY